jgi:lipoyl(octanoyl) transferase
LSEGRKAAARAVRIYRLGLVEYDAGLRLQEIYHAARVARQAPDALFLLSHPPVVTLGRGADRRHVLVPEEDLRRGGILLFETGRGGDVTFHGPSQLIGYPIMDLRPDRMDVGRYLRDLEEVLILALGDLGVEGRRDPGATGVWVGDEKVAAIGVRVARWVTSHGFALNVGRDLEGFRAIVPCGLQGRGVTSLSLLLGREVSFAEADEAVSVRFCEVFGRSAEAAGVARESAQVWISRGERERRRFLLLHRAEARGAIWQPVTGSREGGESLEQCARREVMEETGFTLGGVADLDYAQTFAVDPRFIGAPVPEFTLNREYAFAAEAPGSSEPRLDPKEHDAAHWATAEEALRMVFFEANRVSLRRVISGAIERCAPLEG